MWAFISSSLFLYTAKVHVAQEKGNNKILRLTWSDGKVMRLIFSWLYWQYCSPPTWTAFDLDPSSILTCSGMALQYLSVEYVLDMSGHVCEPCGKGSMEHRALVCHLCVCVCVCVKLSDNSTTTHGKLQQALGDDAMSRAQAFRWHKMFSEGRTLVEDEQHSGRPSATRTGDNTAWIRELQSDWRLTAKMIAEEKNMNWETIRLILTEELGIRKICAKMVPRNLTEQQWDARLSAVFDIQMYYGDAAASLLT
jgi:hypothetical protein